MQFITKLINKSMNRFFFAHALRQCSMLILVGMLSFSAMAQQESKQRYTGADFFNGLDLPLIVGATYTPNGVETAGFFNSMCLEWRWKKTYSWFAPITIDTHNSNYSNLQLPNSNIFSGTVWYTEINLGVGHRIPLVKHIPAFYAAPRQQPLNLFVSVMPGVSIPTVKNVTPSPSPFSPTSSSPSPSPSPTSSSPFSPSPTSSSPLYDTPDASFTIVPSIKFNIGLEWLVDPRLCLFFQGSYIQHLTPTVIEQAAINAGLISHPNGPLAFSIGLSTFFL